MDQKSIIPLVHTRMYVLNRLDFFCFYDYVTNPKNNVLTPNRKLVKLCNARICNNAFLFHIAVKQTMSVHMKMPLNFEFNAFYLIIII